MVRILCNGGADGIVSESLKKTQEKPLNIRVYCHLLILALSPSDPQGPFGHPHNARIWQQLATVDSDASLSNAAAQISRVVLIRGLVHDRKHFSATQEKEKCALPFGCSVKESEGLQTGSATSISNDCDLKVLS